MKRLWIIAVIIGLALCLFFYYLYTRPSSADTVRMAFLDIGQGDAAYIRFPNGQDMLVDCGKDRRILSALGRQMRFFDRTIDYLIVTHPDMDHYGGCTDVLKRFTVKNIVHNGGAKNYDDVWKYFWNTVEKERAGMMEINTEHTLALASATLHFLYPDQPVDDVRLEGKRPETNDTSIVFLLQFAGKSALFTGDAEFPLEKYLIEKYGSELDVDILKVGHHGSAGSTSDAFVEATSPAHAIFSVGKENRYGHPSLRVIRRLERAGAAVWRTDTGGDIIVTYDNHSADGFTVVSKK